MNTQYGHEHYGHADPLPFPDRKTVEEMPAIKTPSQPLKEPPAHGYKKDPVDQLASHSQRMIRKYANDIFTILQPPCTCQDCQNGVMVSLSDLISECMTDQTILTLTLGKLQRSFDRLNDNIERMLGGQK